MFSPQDWCPTCCVNKHSIFTCLGRLFSNQHNNKHWLVVWNIFYFPIYWESHHPNWLIFFRGVAQPPTRTSCKIALFSCRHPAQKPPQELMDLDALVGGRVSVPKEQARINSLLHSVFFFSAYRGLLKWGGTRHRCSFLMETSIWCQYVECVIALDNPWNSTWFMKKNQTGFFRFFLDLR